MMSAGQFTKWREVQSRHRSQVGSAEWRALLAKSRVHSPERLLDEVNRTVNAVRYLNDPQDHWKTPTEFLRTGGDCEEYAFTKMLLLRALGVPASSMRILALDARPGLAAHMVLVVDSPGGPMVLDNLRSGTYPLSQNLKSRMVYAVSETNWWLATRGRSIIATAR